MGVRGLGLGAPGRLHSGLGGSPAPMAVVAATVVVTGPADGELARQVVVVLVQPDDVKLTGFCVQLAVRSS